MAKEQAKLKNLLWTIYTNIENAYDWAFIKQHKKSKIACKWLDFSIRHISTILFEIYQICNSNTNWDSEKNIGEVNINWKLKFIGDTLIDAKNEKAKPIEFTNVEKMEEYIVNQYLSYLFKYWLNKKESN